MKKEEKIMLKKLMISISLLAMISCIWISNVTYASDIDSIISGADNFTERLK